MVYREHTRRRLRAGLLLLTVLGLLSLGFGLTAPNLAPDVAPSRVTFATATRLPSAGPFGGTIALYGNSSEDTRPKQEILGCRMHTGDGRTTRRGFSESGAANLDRRVVNEQALLPLLEIRDSAPDWSITCDGAGATNLEPLYLVTTTGQRDLVPMAAFSFATLALVLGTAGVITFRPQEL